MFKKFTQRKINSFEDFIISLKENNVESLMMKPICLPSRNLPLGIESYLKKKHGFICHVLDIQMNYSVKSYT